MPLLSRNAQLEVDNAKDGIEDFQERIDNLNGFINGFVLWVQDLERFARQISQIEQDLMKLIEKHFGAGSTEAQQLIERTRIGTVPPGLTKDGLHRQLERNVARAQDALQDGISILQERIATLRATGATTPKPVVRENKETPTTKKDPIFILKPTLWGIGVDLREIWKRWRGR
jgi:DNA repair exonuclease SbcCD ATPase subunit